MPKTVKPPKKIVVETLQIFKKTTKPRTPRWIHAWALKHPDSAWYAALEWDDTKAGYRYRLEQIASILRHIKIIPADTTEPVRVTVSLSSDKGGGYRLMSDVLRQPAQYATMLADMATDIRHMQRKYAHLKNISASYQAFDAAIDKMLADVDAELVAA